MFTKGIISALALCTSVSTAIAKTGKATFELSAEPKEQASPETVEQLKASIMQIAYANQGQLENRAEVRKLLAPLVRKLTLLNPTATKREELAKLEGAWYQIWSDDYEPDRPGSQKDSSQIYQVVTDKGYFYNLAEVLVEGETAFTGILRGEYKQGNTGLNIEFVRTGRRAGGLPSDFTISEFITGIESGEIEYEENKNAKYPRGPIGQKGVLFNVYLDDNFRVAIGANNTDGMFDLYVLEKVDNRVSSPE